MTEGERWVRELLAELRADGSMPAFLIASTRRAAETRARRPELARQARAWSLAGALPWMAPPLRRRAGAGLAWWASVALMLDWHLGMVETEQGEARMLGAADACTLLRAWLVPLVAQGAHPVAVGVGLVTDAADGALARRSAPTRAGRDLEGLVDSVFTAAALRGAVRAGRLRPGLAALEAARLSGGLAYAFAAYFGGGRPPSARLAHAARSTAPLRAAGLLLATAGHRRLGHAILGCGIGLGAAATVHSRDAP